MIRNLLEFAMEDDSLDVYFGTPTEIANVICQLGRSSLNDEDILFCDDLNRLPVCMRPAACGDAAELTETCASIGLPISERTAHRIFSGDMPVQPAIIELVPSHDDTPVQIDVNQDRRGLRIAPDDIEDFQISLETAFETIADKYYLSLKDMPKITVTKDRIHVRYDIEKES